MTSNAWPADAIPRLVSTCSPLGGPWHEHDTDVRILHPSQGDPCLSLSASPRARPHHACLRRVACPRLARFASCAYPGEMPGLIRGPPATAVIFAASANARALRSAWSCSLDTVRDSRPCRLSVPSAFLTRASPEPRRTVVICEKAVRAEAVVPARLVTSSSARTTSVRPPRPAPRPVPRPMALFAWPKRGETARQGSSGKTVQAPASGIL